MDKPSKRVFDLSNDEKDKSRKLKAFLEAHPSVDVNLHRDEQGNRALHRAAVNGHVACVRLLVDANADLDARNNEGVTALYWASRYGNFNCLQVLIESKADVKITNGNGVAPVHVSARYEYHKCLRLLIYAKADVNARDNGGFTPAMSACLNDCLACLQLMVDDKADLDAKSYAKYDAVHLAMCVPRNEVAHRVPGMPFAVLSCNTDSQNVNIDDNVTPAMVSAHINKYKQIQAFIDECHSITKHALNEDVVVDKRVGRRGNGLYDEPLEQVLLYLGLSMKKNQTVNTSIDGKHTTRALIPGHPTNANLWFELYQRTHCSSCSARPAFLKKCTCDTTRYCNNKCQRKHWPTHKPSHWATLRSQKNKK
jgi:ankyrin repeat protein